MAMIIEEGISDRSFAISAVANVAGFILLVGCLEWSKHGLADWAQIVLSIVTLGLFGIGFAAWTGWFDKKNTLPTALPRFNRQPQSAISQLAQPTHKPTRLERKVQKMVDKKLKESKWGMNKDGE